MSENVWHSKRTAKQQNLPLLTKCYSMALLIICYHKLSLAFCICSYPIFNNSSLYIFGMLSNLILITSLFNTSSICQKIDTYQALRTHGFDINILHFLNTHKNRPPEFPFLKVLVPNYAFFRFFCDFLMQEDVNFVDCC